MLVLGINKIVLRCKLECLPVYDLSKIILFQALTEGPSRYEFAQLYAENAIRLVISLNLMKKKYCIALNDNHMVYIRAKSTDRDKLTAKRRFRYSGFVTDFVALISSQSEGLGKMALGIVKIYLGSPFSTNRRCSRSVCSRSVGSRSVCRGQLSWTRLYWCSIT